MNPHNGRPDFHFRKLLGEKADLIILHGSLLPNWFGARLYGATLRYRAIRVTI
jgi:phage protein U